MLPFFLIKKFPKKCVIKNKVFIFLRELQRKANELIFNYFKKIF